MLFLRFAALGEPPRQGAAPPGPGQTPAAPFILQAAQTPYWLSIFPGAGPTMRAGQYFPLLPASRSAPEKAIPP
ncbi:MAG: hypothetical protein DBY09_07720 [Selenomonadales bacterium]|nr:MAG: hypothetical protein DBY09_07720 [Selenomonadales bacterium]